MKTSISYSYCNWLKFFSCILIFSGHYFFRDYSKVVGDFGFLGTIIFFFLSAYGIVLSQSKKNLTISNFIMRRVVKVWLPLLCVNFIFILLESFLNGDFLIYKFHLHSPYIEVIKDLNIGTMLLYLLDIYQMDPLTWFLHELIFAYLLIFFLMKIGNRKIRILTSISLYVVFELLFYVFQFPLMQKINTIGILLGFLYSNMGGVLSCIFEQEKIFVLNIISCG